MWAILNVVYIFGLGLTNSCSSLQSAFYTDRLRMKLIVSWPNGFILDQTSRATSQLARVLNCVTILSRCFALSQDCQWWLNLKIIENLYSITYYISHFVTFGQPLNSEN